MPVNILELFDDMEFPATKVELVAHAEDNGASEEVLDILQAMPQEYYRTLTELDRCKLLIEQLPGGDANLFSSSQSR